MGYRLPERTARINFAGTPYDGAEVVLTLKVKVGVYRQMSEMREASDFGAIIDMFCGFIRSWNLEDEDGPIPVTPEGFDRLDDIGFLHALMDGWQAAMTGQTEVAAPLGEPSSNGRTSGSETQPEYLVA